MKTDKKELIEIKSEILKSARITKGLKQDELAKEVFTTRQTISNWENGKKIPTLENINRLAEILDISIEDLIVRKFGEELNTDDEKRLETNINSYSMVYPTIVSRKTIRDLKIIKIILILILVLLAFYLIGSIRKFYILTDIRNKMLEYENVDNYHLNIRYYKITDGIYTDFYTEDIYYLNGMVKRKLEYESDNLCEIESSYISENQKIVIDFENKTYEVSNDEYNYDNLIIDNLYSSEANLNLVKLARNCFNPFFMISDYINYDLNYTYKKRDKLLKINERINRNTGLMEEQVIQSDENNYIKREIEFSKDIVTYEDVELPDLTEYVEK